MFYNPSPLFHKSLRRGHVLKPLTPGPSPTRVEGLGTGEKRSPIVSEIELLADRSARKENNVLSSATCGRGAGVQTHNINALRCIRCSTLFRAIGKRRLCGIHSTHGWANDRIKRPHRRNNRVFFPTPRIRGQQRHIRTIGH